MLSDPLNERDNLLAVEGTVASMMLKLSGYGSGRGVFFSLP